MVELITIKHWSGSRWRQIQQIVFGDLIREKGGKVDRDY